MRDFSVTSPGVTNIDVTQFLGHLLLNIPRVIGHKYTFVKVGHIGAQIDICKSGAQWGSEAHWDTNIHL